MQGDLAPPCMGESAPSWWRARAGIVEGAGRSQRAASSRRTPSRTAPNPLRKVHSMAMIRRRRRRITVIATAVAAVALTAGLATGCDPDSFDDSLNCLQNADTITDSLKA